MIKKVPTQLLKPLIKIHLKGNGRSFASTKIAKSRSLTPAGQLIAGITIKTRSPKSEMTMVPMMGMMTPSSPDNVQSGSAMDQKSQREEATFRERITGHMMRKPLTVQMAK